MSQKGSVGMVYIKKGAQGMFLILILSLIIVITIVHDDKPCSNNLKITFKETIKIHIILFGANVLYTNKSL